MKTGLRAWAALVEAGSGMMETSFQTSEMLVASRSVIGARMTIMCNAARRPAEGDYAEIGEMVLEKVIVVSKVNQALVEQWSVMLMDVSEQAHHLGCMVSDGRPMTARDLSRLAEQWVAHGSRMITRTMDAGGLALAPVHQQATANARRLS